MSLINDALKKAQRQRTGDAPGMPMTGASVSGRRGMPTQTMILIGAGALLLVCLSVALTVFLTSSPPPTQAKPSPLLLSQQKMGSSPAVANATPTIVFPAVEKPVAAVPASSVPAKPAPGPSVVPVTAAPKAVLSKTAEQIQDMVDKYRVSGVRSSATGSKVLMNDHIVKLNEIVDRESGLKLVKIEDSSLTFQDANGIQYSKNF